MAHQFFESAPHFRPYRWAAMNFQVGLQPISADDWLLMDDDYESFMRHKKRHLAGARDRFYRTLPISLDAQRELRDMVVNHLIRRHPAFFSRSAGVLHCRAGGASWDLRDESVEPLWQLTEIVQEDFMLLQEIEGKYTITAASNAYSSSGRLVASVGHDVRWAHEPVPDLTALHGARIDRILSSVHESAVCARFNWQLTPMSRLLFPPDPHAANKDTLRFVTEQLKKDPSLAPSLLHMRVERQTLRRLPDSRAVVFSLHTYTDPLHSLIPDRISVDALIELLKGYSPERLQYNEMEGVRDAVVVWLESLRRCDR